MNNIKEEFIPICKNCNKKMKPIYSMDVDEFTGKKKLIVDYFSCPDCLSNITVDDSFDITIN